MSACQERRSCQRLPIQGEVDFRRARESAYPIVVEDISAVGCRISPPVNVAEGDRIWVKFGGLESLQSTVRWTRGWKAGARFEHPMHPAVFASLAKRLRIG